jgi:hypothetical protein
MGIVSNELNGNNCYINSNSIAFNGINNTFIDNECETLLLGTSHQNISLISHESHDWTPIESVIDMNQLIINTNDLNGSETQQQILLVSSPMDLMTKSSTVQMVLPQLNVIQVPTSLLLTDNLIVIPQEGIALEVPAIDSTITLSPNGSQTAIDNSLNYQNKSWFNDSQLMAQGINAYNSNASVDMALVTLNDCIAYNGINKSIDNSIHCYSQTISNNQNDFFHDNNQMIGIIDEQSNDAITGSINTSDDYDVNAFLASSLSSTTQEECDPNEAKQWHSDSVIAFRAMLAFKNVMSNNGSNANSVQTK